MMLAGVGGGRMFNGGNVSGQAEGADGDAGRYVVAAGMRGNGVIAGRLTGTDIPVFAAAAKSDQVS